LAVQRTQPDQPASPGVRDVWVPFSHLAIWAYILYGLGLATPYLRTDLSLTEFQAGLHASAMAAGILTAGVIADSIGRRVGAGRLRVVASALIIVAIGLVALAPGLPVSLAGALLLGLGGGTLGTDVTIRLGRFGGVETRRLMIQANAAAMLMAAAAPLAMGLAASLLHAWRLALMLPAIALVVLLAIRPHDSEPHVSIRPPRASLPRAYWVAWLLIVLGVSIEFSFVFWGSTIVGKRTGVSSANATLLASLFVVGMLVGRIATGRGLGARLSPRTMLASGLVVVVAGAGLTWLSTTAPLSGLGLLLGGLGTAGLYPIGLTVALHTAPKARLEAAARATLASGLAVFLAPSALGLAADAIGVVTAWLIVVGLAVAGLAVRAVTPRASDSPGESTAV
jgi:MFS family permease